MGAAAARRVLAGTKVCFRATIRSELAVELSACHSGWKSVALASTQGGGGAGAGPCG